MSKANEEIENKAFKLAEEYEKKCTGCCQTTIGGICDTLNIKVEALIC